MVFSAAVSVKMNVLLMAPPVLVVLLKVLIPHQLSVNINPSERLDVAVVHCSITGFLC